MLGAPGGKEVDSGAKGFAFGGEGVFDAGWDFGIGPAGDDAVGFEFFELAGEDFEGHAGDGAVDLAEAEGAIHEDVDDDGLPFASVRINVVSPGVVEDSPGYFPYFHGHIPVTMDRVVAAYVKSVLGAQTGQVYKVS